MPRIFGWFNNSQTLLSCIERIRHSGMVSVLLRQPNERVLVMGPLTKDVGPYPFLDVQHHIRRLGLPRPWAEKYTRILEKGGVVVCVDVAEPSFTDILSQYQARDLTLIP
ncbi:hypothetical protein [Sulfobacillus thermosulfidooxidans]|uniref:hypothetical protein n=1 Tax=Sulfobacillus thermosulfidooxidans TaxID=28034 RepID=UPI00096BC581|nr:hypothetical protein [Sulfobacillus thermosulfidooxidans]OLZ11675.1 hypothetical protein BFX05_06660 [Sulfobacillus thermosulfidooxidans]OLZ18638.1 hypothetical protein BFX06_00255 [Sulfobacillus thermosulfidooxidans]OLZ20283.1 hypothetical protein BFX07_01545 [Sulfobacillus thermosulfidooxidans]